MKKSTLLFSLLVLVASAFTQTLPPDQKQPTGTPVEAKSPAKSLEQVTRERDEIRVDLAMAKAQITSLTTQLADANKKLVDETVNASKAIRELGRQRNEANTERYDNEANLHLAQAANAELQAKVTDLEKKLAEATKSGQSSPEPRKP